MSQSGGDAEVFTTCPICCDELVLNNSSLLNCGHVYHFDCIQRMYEYDWNKGNRSCCTMCRKPITSKPNKVYGKYPKEKMFYTIEKEALQPNINGKRVKVSLENGNPITVISEDEDEDEDEDEYEEQDNEELIEFYEDRLADLERHLEEYRERTRTLEAMRSELNATKVELSREKRRVDERNLKIEKLLKENFELTEGLAKNTIKLDAALDELENFKYSKMAMEVNRLATQISVMQKGSYYKNLLSDSGTTREILVGMLSGMERKHAEVEGERNQILRENRMLRIQLETIQKKSKQIQQQQQQQNQIPQLKMKSLKSAYDDAGETELDEPSVIDLETDEDDKENMPMNPFAVKTASSKMVPSVLPKGFSVPKGASNGTGQKRKVIELPNGQNFFL